MEKDLAKSIGSGARRAREALGLTQQDAAERIGTSVEFYSRIERGHSLPSIQTFVHIAVALGVSTDTLLFSSRRIDDPASDEGQPDWALVSADSPELRRIVRRLRKASPASLRVVNLLLKELENL